MANDGIGTALSHGRYVITEKLGEGGMGTVYRARDQNIDADVVVKVPLRAMLSDAEFAARFKNEIRSLVLLSHPHIVKVSDVGDWDGLPFAVMQFLQGGSLEDRLKQGKSDPRDVLEWVLKVAEALDFVHSRGYIHRDVKPGNILFDLIGHPFLGDFGVVKVLAETADASASKASMTGAGMVIGTVEYMAPEIIMGEPFDGRADQYALAATVYEMISGRQIFSDSVKTKVLVLQTSKAPVPLTTLCPGISEAVWEIVRKGLEKDPANRFPTCAKFARAVAAAIEATPVLSAAPTLDRIRVACPACGKMIAIAASDHTKLIRKNMSFPCPGCKTSISVVADPARVLATTTKIAAPMSAAGTTKQSMPPPPPAAATMKLPARGAQVTPAGTMKLSIPPAGGTPAGTVKLSAQATRVPLGGTMKLAAPDLSDRPDLFPAINTNAAGSPVTNVAGARSVGEPSAISFPWAIVAGGVSVAALIFAMGFWFLRPASKSSATDNLLASSAANRASNTPQKKVETTKIEVASLSTPKGSRPIPPPRPVTPAPETVEPSASTDPDTASNKEAPPAEEPASRDTGNEETKPSASEAENGLTVKFGRRQVSGMAIKRVLANPELCSNMAVELSGVFRIADVIARDSLGRMTLPLSETETDLLNNGQTKIIKESRANLEVEPKLAKLMIHNGLVRAIDSLPVSNPKWGENPAIVSVQSVSREGKPVLMVVKFEFFIKFVKNIIKPKNSYKRKLHIDFITKTLTTEGMEDGEGLREAWEKIPRLGHFVVAFEKMFDRSENTLNQAERDRIDATINAAVGAWTRDANQRNAINEMRIRDSMSIRPLR